MGAELSKSVKMLSRCNCLQALCPAPSRLIQDYIMRDGLKTGLDVGCGVQSILSAMRAGGFRTTGIDVSKQMLDRARRCNAHDEYIEGNFLELDELRKYDVVVLSEVIEHFTHEDGEMVLDQADRLAERLVYVETPNGFLEQPELDGNPFQKHLSGWTAEDFESRGYKVYGIGIKGLRGEVGRAWMGMERMVRFVERLTRWYYFRRPDKAFALGAVKRKQG